MIYIYYARDKAIEHLGNDTVLYTTDGADFGHLNKGKIPGVYATVDFGSGQDPTKKFGEQRKIEPHGMCIFLKNNNILQNFKGSKQLLS